MMVRLFRQEYRKIMLGCGVLLLCLLTSISYSLKSNTYTALLVSRSSLDKKTPLLTLLDVSEIHCTARCTEDNACLYIHHQFDNKCYLYKTDGSLPQTEYRDQNTVIFIKRPVICDNLPICEHAKTTVSVTRTARAGDTATYSCRRGYLPKTGGVATITCLPTGQWEKPTLVCKEQRGDRWNWYYCRNHIDHFWGGGWCSGSESCEDGLDELDCRIVDGCIEGMSRCPDGSCIKKCFFCDEGPDCDDGSDEQGCEVSIDRPCYKSYYVPCNDGQCINIKHWCDDDYDCDDRSDELMCPPDFCDPFSHFECNDGTCIPIMMHCNGENECFHGEDEADC